jgi:hypothetical protein
MKEKRKREKRKIPYFIGKRNCSVSEEDNIVVETSQ